ncbi:uncharacterized protein LOC108096355 [Drosophila ficusphila]|uniref:uncharacterized protein LOC108096355 n=1 Tax=Drosophila ficusphila TaxID=30025 RepID=UPI0007E7B561|nr:uncharacterized protein LOC108096355 [Drosophila ficusphila]
MSGWYLQHVTTGRRYILYNGDNSVGRHSRCRIVLGATYQYVSREHAKLIVSDNEVILETLNPLNGIFVNNGKLGSKIRRMAVEDGCTISLGVSGVDVSEITSLHAIFYLRKMAPNVAEVIISSDDDDTTPLPAVKSSSGKLPTEFNLNQQIPEMGNIQNEEEQPSSSGLHLPKIPVVKQEALKAATENIKTIFGEANEDILLPILDINPYLFNELNNKTVGVATAHSKIFDGDVIELDTDVNKEQPDSERQQQIDSGLAPPKQIDVIELEMGANKENSESEKPQQAAEALPREEIGEEELEENYAHSQAVYMEMKTEMAYGDEEEDFLNNNGLDDVAQGSPSGSAYDDDVVINISDSDDDELYDKVADWSKLLSQNVVPDVHQLSQAYPMQEEEDSDSDRDVGNKLPRALRIISSSEDESGDEVMSSNDHVVRQADSTTSDHPIRDFSVRVKKYKFNDDVSSTERVEPISENDKPKPKSCLKTLTKEAVNDNDKMEETGSSSKDEADPSTRLLDNRSKSSNMERTEKSDEPLTNNETENLKENTRDMETVDNREELVVILEAPKTPENIEKPKRNYKKRTTKEKTEPIKKPLRSRSKSCYFDRPVKEEPKDNKKKESPEESKKPDKKEADVNKSSIRHRRKTINNREEFEAIVEETHRYTPTKPNLTNPVNGELPSSSKSPAKRSPRLLNRSKSCCVDSLLTANEITPTKSDTSTRVQNSSEARLTRGPSVIEAPCLPSHRGKLRGVSAEVKRTNKDMQKVIERQQYLNNLDALKSKWIQKPKDKKKEDEQIRDKRREALKKLSGKPKENDNIPSTSKRKQSTSVPTVQHSNRGEFLTKGVEGPPAKVAKKDEAKPTLKKPVSNRRHSIESFSQQLQAADGAVHHPQPLCPRPAERKEACQARNQRTCNKVTFAEMELYRQNDEDLKRLAKKRRKVHFNDNVTIHIIDKVTGASARVKGRKESMKLNLSSYRERREWFCKGNKRVNDIRQHSRSILEWANQWLKHGSVDAVADREVLLPIPSDFKCFRQYLNTLVPLMKLELLTTIERDYKVNAKNSFSVGLKTVSSQDNCYRLVCRVNSKPFGKFVLYTLSSGTQLNETFASLVDLKCVGGNVFDLTFDIIKQDISDETINSLKQLTARPVVDSLRVELGALSAVHQLYRSPLCRRILKPTQTVNEVSLPKQPFVFKGCNKLNEHQEHIIIRTYQRVIDDLQPSLTLIQGPPGTGKSKVISELCLQTLYGVAAKQLDRKILICAHSNTAVDHIVGMLGRVLRLMSHDHFQLLRFGMHDKMTHYSQPFSLEEHFKRHKNKKVERLGAENIEILKKQRTDLEADILRLKQNPKLTGTYLQQQLHQKERQLQLINEQLNPVLTQREEFQISQSIISHANIICTTLSSCVKLANYVDFFDICIIDEATQCTEPWTLLPMRFSLTHLVLVGDTQQLPAVVLSKKATEYGLSNSMFDRIQRSLDKQLDMPGGNQFVHTKIFKLSVQYRMHPEICRWPNKYFYEDQLVNGNGTERLASPLIPYCVINLSYTQDSSGAQNKSICNDEEARFVAKLLTEMDKYMPTNRYSYGLISPYQSQCMALSQVIPDHMQLTPQTVDSYQGLEKDVVIISNARTRGCGFLTNYQRLNVALTRPRRCLVICGNFQDLKTVDMWRQLLDDARQRKVYFDLERAHVDDLQTSLIKKMMVKQTEVL